ncbi:MAG TPA: helix-turn-helix transcriptional regulator [Gemmatimonadales bacterium]|nr:helix-turn-helix transcriptional regulator [Gemmatimonadales bacterium]
MEPRLTYAMALVLAALAHGYRYGFDIMDVTALPSGTVYPALRRLARGGYLRARWEDQERAHRRGRPARRYYELTGTGRALAAATRARYPNAALALRPAAGGHAAR